MSQMQIDPRGVNFKSKDADALKKAGCQTSDVMMAGADGAPISDDDFNFAYQEKAQQSKLHARLQALIQLDKQMQQPARP